MIRLIIVSAFGVLENFLPSSILVLVLGGTIGNLAILSSVGARLLLNMKEAGEKGLNEGMGGSGLKATVDGMEFAAPAQTLDTEGGEETEITAC